MMKKRLYRLLGALLTAAALTGLLTAPAAAEGFRDVPATHWAAESVRRGVELKFFQGETADRFGVGHGMTRSSFAVVLCRVMGWELSKTPRQIYEDVPVTAGCAAAVEAAYDHGVLTDQSGKYRPGDALTREALAVFLVRALGYGTLSGLVQELPTPFTDVTSAAGYISMAYNLGLISGATATTFDPASPATREQVAVVVMRLYDKLHAPKLQTVGIIPSDKELENLGDLSRYDAVAISAGKLTCAGSEAVTPTMSREEAASLREKARSAGAKAMLHIVGGPTALNGTAEASAAVLKTAVQDYDGLLLNIPELNIGKKRSLEQLVARLPSVLEGKPLYLIVEAPSWRGRNYTGYDYAILGASVDKLILRGTSSYEDAAGPVPISPVDPLEEVYYVLDAMKGKVETAKLSLLLDTTAISWLNGKKNGPMTGQEVDAVLADPENQPLSQWSGHYSCAWLTAELPDPQDRNMIKHPTKHLTVWYPDSRFLADRARMAVCFGVDQICFTDIRGLSASFLDGLN